MSAMINEFRKLVRQLEDLSYEMLKHPKAEELCEIIEELQAWGCKSDKHSWVFDQCGYWQHQFCIECGAAKYPDMSRKSCSELTSAMGKTTEEEFLRKQ